MRVLLLGINYAPERTGIAPYTTALARHLAREHEVTVITGMPHYPQWQVPAGYRRWRIDEVVDGVRVIRLRHYVPARQSVANRLAYELTWAPRAAAAGARVSADVVIAVVPALFAAQTARVVARRSGAAVGVFVQDVMASAAAQSGVRGGRTARRLITAVERSGLAAADAVATIHPRLADELQALAERDERPAVIYNWTHVRSRPNPASTLRARLGWPADEVVALHSGNMGLKQSLEVVVDAARMAERDDDPVRFVLAGDGSQRAHLERYGASCSRLQFLDTVDDADYLDLLAAADVLLVNERPGMQEMSLPSKLTSYLVAGRPIIAATEHDSATAEFVRASGGGIVCAPGNPRELVETVRKLAVDIDAGERLVEAGQEFARTCLDENSAFAAYDTWLTRLHARRAVRGATTGRRRRAGRTSCTYS